MSDHIPKHLSANVWNKNSFNLNWNIRLKYVASSPPLSSFSFHFPQKKRTNDKKKKKKQAGEKNNKEKPKEKRKQQAKE